MLPSIHTQNRAELPHNRILISIRLDLHTARLCILHQPRPPTALNARQGRVELLLERIQAAIAVINRLAEGAARRLAAALARRRQILPEKAVVDVSAAVEVDEGLQGDLGLDIVFGFGFGDLLAEVVVRGYVGVVVVLVV